MAWFRVASRGLARLGVACARWRDRGRAVASRLGRHAPLMPRWGLQPLFVEINPKWRDGVRPPHPQRSMPPTFPPCVPAPSRETIAILDPAVAPQPGAARAACRVLAVTARFAWPVVAVLCWTRDCFSSLPTSTQAVAATRVTLPVHADKLVESAQPFPLPTSRSAML